MTDRRNDIRTGRRQFLKGVMAVGGTTVLVAVGAEAVSQAPQADEAGENEAAKKRGYHLTPHIETYYQKARF